MATPGSPQRRPHPAPHHTTFPANNEFDGPCRPCSPPSTPQAPKDSALIKYSAPTAILSSGEPDPTPPSKTGTSTPIFRITGIPLSATQQDLMGVLISEFATEENILPLASRLVCCPSCYDGRTQTALLEFAPARAPSVLLDFLDDGVNKGYMISYPSGGDIAIDQDFYGLTQLYPTCHSIKADIVAVCDLGQHAYRSWCGEADNRGIERMWLRDFLQEDLPSCRTMIYGYDSRLRGACGLREVPDYKDVLLEELRKARRALEVGTLIASEEYLTVDPSGNGAERTQEKNRPIIFISHGFGGMLIAEAVVKAKANTDRYGALFESTIATMFYAIPNLAQVVDDILLMIGDDSTRGDLVNSLRRRAEGEVRNFINCSSSHGTRVINYKAVDQTQSLTKGENGEWAKTGDLFSAAGQEPGMPQIPDSIKDTLIIDGDHSTLVKFQYKAQLSYTSVLMYLEECTNNTELLGQDMTPETAIKNGTYDDLVRVLQTRTVDINAPLNHVPGAPTLLQIATSTGSIRKVDLLLEKGATIGARNGNGSTALREAIASKNVKLVELLLQIGGKNQPLGPCPGNYNWMYELPLLHFACAEGNREIVEILVKAGDVGLEDRAGDMNHHPLHFAAVNKDSSVLEMLVGEKKVDIELQDKLQKTALHLAAISGLSGNTRLLLSHGAKIEARDILGGTPLQLAVESENEEVVDMLLGNGADIAAPGMNGNTPLHAACAGRNEKIAKKLLDRGTDTERRNGLGMTPLLCAAWSGSKSIFELLVRKKADVTAVDKQCRALLHIAAGNMNEDLVELILSHGADIEARDENEITPLLAAVKRSNAPVVKSLLKNGASTASRNKEGTPPLHIAITKGSYEVIKHLLDHKADVQARGKLEDTPLHIAAKNGNERIIELLLEHRADMKARNRLLMRPIDVAKRQKKMACARLLKEGSPGSEGRE